MSPTEPTLNGDTITRSISVLPCDGPGTSRIRPYRAIYLTYSHLQQEGIEVPPRNVNRPVLLLSGTSFTMEDRIKLIQAIADAGYEVASIETEQGGLFDVMLDPPQDRVDALRHFLHHLEDTTHVEEITVLALSYSAYEIVRLLVESPAHYRRRIKRILFINPAGLNPNIGFFSHSKRFFYHHAWKGYLDGRKKLKQLSGSSPSEAAEHRTAEIEFYRSELLGIATLMKRMFTNSARTFREVADIISFQIKDALVTLQDDFGYGLYFFLQSDDQLLPVEISLAALKGVIPAENIRIAPGGHVDLIFQKWQRKALCDFIEEIRCRRILCKHKSHR